MMLHIFIDGKERLREDVKPGHLDQVLGILAEEITTLRKHCSRYTLCLDSDRHPNVTYLLNRRHTDG